MESARPQKWRDAALAAGIVLLLSVVWAMRDWAALSSLHLPDTDDVVRLQQIRDWLGGQAFGDLTQQRLGSGGVEMHWSRLPDVAPAAAIALLTPLLGTYAAELAAMIAYPALLFVAALVLTGSIARALGISAPAAIVIAALAYPASALFVPGRIDHHGLQLVLLLALTRALFGRGSWQKGAAAGLVSAVSVAIGMEMVPLLAAGGAVLAIRWIVDDADERARLAGYGLLLSAGLAAAALFLRTNGWSYPACDGFAAPSWRAAQLGALAPLALVLIAPGLKSIGLRLTAAGAIGVLALIAMLVVSPACLHPYGEVDPVLAQIWLANVAEAEPLLGAPFAHAVGYAGLLVVGLVATIWMWRRSKRAEWLVLLVFQLVSLAVTLTQLRGAYAGAMLAAPALAGMVGLARERGVFPLAAAWIAAAGFIYPVAGAVLSGRAGGDGAAACDARAALRRLAKQPRGKVAAPIDLGAYALATTPHDVLAAPYHRNDAGNRAVYRLLRLPPDAARIEAERLHLDYFVDCPGAYGELGRPPAGSLLASLRTARAPTWLRPVHDGYAGTIVYAVVR